MNRIRKLRTAAGMTQQDLAWETDLSIRTVAELDAGKQERAHPNTLKALAFALEWPEDRYKELLEEVA